MTTIVVNIRLSPYDIYIGRKKDSDQHYGNPFSHLTYSLAEVKVSTKSDSVQCYKNWLLGKSYQEIEPERRKWILSNLDYLKGKRLGCFCKSDQKEIECHGDVLVELLHNNKKM